MEPCRCLNSHSPQGPTHTNPRPHPLLFVLPSFLWECNWLCVWVSLLFVCVMWLFHCNGCLGTKTLLEEIQAHVSGPILTLSLSTSFPLFLLICVTIEPKYMNNRYIAQIVYCTCFFCCRYKKETFTKSKNRIPEIDWSGLFWGGSFLHL